MADLSKLIDAEHQKKAEAAEAALTGEGHTAAVPQIPIIPADSVLSHVAAAATHAAPAVASTAATIAKEVAQDTVASVQDMVSHAGDLTKDVHSVADAQELLKHATEQLAKAAMHETIEKIEGVIGIDIDQDGTTGAPKAQA
jgi:hypothetical protein